MGHRRSFRIESKQFDIALEGGGSFQIKITECGKRHTVSILLGRDGARWLAKYVDENVMRVEDPSFIRTYRESEQGFVITRHGNDNGRYLEVVVYGKGGLKGRLVIPEGRDQGGWRGFGAELRILLDSEQQPNRSNAIKPKMGMDKNAGKGVQIGREMVENVNRSIDNGSRHNWRQVLFPCGENNDMQKRQERDTRREAGTEQSLGFGAKISDAVNVGKELFLNLKIRLMCGPDGQWHATWAGLAGTAPEIEHEKPRGPQTQQPKSNKPKQIWQPRGPRCETQNTNGPPKIQPDRHPKPIFTRDPLTHTSFELGESSGTCELHNAKSEIEAALLKPTPIATEVQPPIVSTAPEKDPHALSPSVTPVKGALDLVEAESTRPSEGETFSVRFGDFEEGNVGNVAHAWGTSSEWYIELRDGQRLRLSMELVPPAAPNATEHQDTDDDILSLLDWYDFGELYAGGVQDEDGILSIANSAHQDDDDVGSMRAHCLPQEGEMEPLSVSPLAVAPPQGDEVHKIEGHGSTNGVSQWVDENLKAFRELVGTSFEGYEEEVIALLVSIEARRNQHQPPTCDNRSARKKGTKGSRELKGLISSINYDSRAIKVAGTTRDGAKLLTR
jgi:hypothetical protein